MLKVKNLRTSYGKNEILKGLDFEVSKEDIVAVIGESGTGKTTLALAIMGLLRYQQDNVKISGEIVFNGIDLSRLKEDELKKIRWSKISIVFQNVDNILNPVIPVFKQIKEILNSNDGTSIINDMLEKMDFPVSRAYAYPYQLSMGEKQKVMLAMAYILNPEFVILDEPTSALDFESKNNLIKIIKELSSQKAVLLATHDLDTAQNISNKTVVLYGGNIIESGSTKDVFTNPRHPYTRGLIRSYPSETRTKDLQGIKGNPGFTDNGCCFWPRCTQAIQICKEEKPLLTESNGRKIACHRDGIIPLVSVSRIKKNYEKRSILKSISFDVYEGETLTILGRSGSGKTTLAKIIMGLIKPDDGEICLENMKVTCWDSAFYKKVQMIFQDTRAALSHRLNILESVTEPLLIQKCKSNEEMVDAAKQVLSEVGLPGSDDFLYSYPHHLSGGELQRVVIARALILSPRVLIADEPTSALDPSIQAKVLKLLNQIQEQRGLGMLFITHDLGVARKVSDRVMEINNGILKEKILR